VGAGVFRVFAEPLTTLLVPLARPASQYSHGTATSRQVPLHMNVLAMLATIAAPRGSQAHLPELPPCVDKVLSVNPPHPMDEPPRIFSQPCAIFYRQQFLQAMYAMSSPAAQSHAMRAPRNSFKGCSATTAFPSDQQSRIPSKSKAATLLPQSAWRSTRPGACASRPEPSAVARRE
jgi:hypothetical protein